MNLWQTMWPEESRDRWVLLVALFVALVTGYFLFVYRSELGGLEGAVKIGTLKTEESARIRHAKSLKWGRLNKESAIFLKDMVYVPRGKPAEFFWKDKKLILEPETLVQFDEATMDNLEITLFDGKIKSEADSARFLSVVKTPAKTVFFKPQKIEYLPDVNAFVIKHSELSQRALETIAKKIELEPERGVVMPKLYLNQLSDYQLVTKAPLNQKYPFNSKEWVAFEWVALPLKNINYKLEIAMSEDLDKKVVTDTTLNRASVLFQVAGEYFWRVSAERKKELIEGSIQKFELVQSENSEAKPREVGSAPVTPSSPGNETAKVKEPANVKNINGKKTEKTAFEILFGK